MTPREIIREEGARLRDLLASSSPILSAYARARPDARDSIDDALVFRVHRIAGPTLAGYPSPDVAAQYVLGASLASLAPALRRVEAAAWIRQSEHEDPSEWLAAQVARRHGVELPTTLPVDVTRWLDAALADPARRAALERSRTARMGEVVVEGRLLERVDELRPVDLARSVADTFAAAAQRLAKAAWDGPDELMPAEPWHGRLPAGVSVLRTATDLWIEGAECRHCVGVYAERVYRRECMIVRVIADDGSRSTVEVVAGRVTQHRGPGNAEPSEACRRLVGACHWR